MVVGADIVSELNYISERKQLISVFVIEQFKRTNRIIIIINKSVCECVCVKEI